MQALFRLWDFDRILPETAGTLLTRIETPVILIQLGAIVVAGAAAFWLSTLLRPRLTEQALHLLPRNWTPTFVKVAASVAPPVIWLLLLWPVTVIGTLLGYALPLASAGVGLLVAWVCIRLLSFSVKSPLVSATISVVVWSIAALSILGLLDPLMHELDASAIRLGKYRVSALTAINALFVLAALLWLTTILFRFLQRQITHMTSLTPSLQVLLTQLLQILLPAIAVVVALSYAGIDLTVLTVVFGAVGLGIGLGLQRVVGNLVAGLTLLMGKSIKPGDIIEYKNGYGWVSAMGARYVTLRTRDGVEHLVPNDYFLENGVENWSYSDVRLRLRAAVGIAYDSDVHRAIALCIEAAKSVKRVLEYPEPLCLLKGFGNNSIDL